MSEKQQSTFALVAKLGCVAAGMFAFALWIMPPLYILLCEVTGLRKVDGAYEAVDNEVDTSREITVQFVATHNDAMPWDFKPSEHKVKVHPGEPMVIKYLAKNKTDETMVAQAIPSIMPFNAVNFFHKTECFCFEQQPLEGGEEAELGLRFIVDQELPKSVRTITLSYTLFDITERVAQEDAEQLAAID